MKRIINVTIIAACLIMCKHADIYAQETWNISDIKGIWVSSLSFNEITDEYELIPSEDVISFGFTEVKGKVNNARYTGLYRKISEGRPKLLYFFLEGNKVQFYDSSDNPLSYFLVIETMIPKVSMTATLIHKEETNTFSTKIKFLFYEKQN